MSILNKIHIHETTYLFLLVSLFTGQFRLLMLLFVVILIHEFGHILASKYFGWNIVKVNIFPFGGNIVYDVKLNESSFNEFMVTVMGPVFQILGTFVLTRISFLTHNEVLTLKNLSYSLVIFNLLPIIPLDGSKLFFSLTNSLMSYKRSHKLLIFISTFFIFIFLFKQMNNFTIQIIIFFLIYKTYEQYKNHNNILNKFLLERYLYDLKQSRVKIHNKLDVKCIYKNRINFFKYNNKCYSEKNVLDNYFKNRKNY